MHLILVILIQSIYLGSASSSLNKSSGWVEDHNDPPADDRNNTMDYVQIMSTGDAVDFGDLMVQLLDLLLHASNGHGGLG